MKKFGFDGWFIYGSLSGKSKDDKRKFRRVILEKTHDKIVVRDYCETPEGTLWQERVYFRDNPEVLRPSNWVKDMERDFEIYLKYFFPDPSSCDDKNIQEQKKEIGDWGIVGACIGYPGIHDLYIGIIDGGLERAIRVYYQHHDLVKKYAKVYEDWAIEYTRRLIEAQPDFILTGASGTLVFNSPRIFRELGLPTQKRITRMAKEAGVPTMLHSCGREYELVEICAKETDLDCINPLEPPPSGDCDLAEVKQRFGSRLSLMGNLHTSLVTLGTPAEIRREAKRAIDAAKEGGGFILSTGDECGPNTPEENIYEIVKVARTYGRYK